MKIVARIISKSVYLDEYKQDAGMFKFASQVVEGVSQHGVMTQCGHEVEFLVKHLAVLIMSCAQSTQSRGQLSFKHRFVSQLFEQRYFVCTLYQDLHVYLKK